MTNERKEPWEGAPEGDLASARREPSLPDVDTRKWSLQLLQALEWLRFEVVCAAYFEQLGFRTRRSTGGPDGGVDIHLFSNQDTTPGVIVQCKAWRKWRVGVDEIRAFFGVMTADKIAEGIFITSSRYSDEAKQFAVGKNIHLIDGPDLLNKIKQLTLAQEDGLLRLATHGDFTTPSCPSCRVKLKLRSGKTSGNYFWGCVYFPKCKFTLQIPKSG
jgi:restriction system protein